jgi:hypothetical protein
MIYQKKFPKKPYFKRYRIRISRTFFNCGDCAEVFGEIKAAMLRSFEVTCRWLIYPYNP